MRIGQSAAKDFAYILGVYLGDGCVVGGRQFKLNTIDRDFADACVDSLYRLTGKTAKVYTYPVKKSDKLNHQVYVTDEEFCQKLVNDTQDKKLWPQYVTTWDKPTKIAFIVGLMDSEGFVAENKTNPTNRRFYMGFKSTDAWVHMLVRLMESVGIRTGKISTEKPMKPGYRIPVRFHIKMQSWIDSGARFNIARKQRRVDAWAEFGPYEKRAKNPRRSCSEANMPNAHQGRR